MVVSHDAVNREVLATVDPNLGDPDNIPQDNGCFNIRQWANGGLVVLSVNELPPGRDEAPVVSGSWSGRLTGTAQRFAGCERGECGVRHLSRRPVRGCCGPRGKPTESSGISLVMPPAWLYGHSRRDRGSVLRAVSVA